MPAPLKRLKRGDDNELERNLCLEKVVASKQLVDHGDRRRKGSKTAATKRLRLAMETDEERKARLEKKVAPKHIFLHQRIFMFDAITMPLPYKSNYIKDMLVISTLCQGNNQNQCQMTERLLSLPFVTVITTAPCPLVASWSSAYCDPIHVDRQIFEFTVETSSS